MAKRSAARNWVETAAVRAILGCIRRLPRDVAERVARVVVGALDWLVPKLRATALRNLEFAMPALGLRERRQMADAVFRSLARMLVAVAKLPDITKDNVGEWIRYEGFEHFAEAKARGKGVLFATGHLGAWELSHYAHALMAEPMSIVVRPLDNPLLDNLVTERRAGSGNAVIGRNDYVRPILEALRRNEAVGVLVDQNMAEGKGVFVDFFGIKACVEAGVAKIAARTGAAVIPGFAVWSREERKFILRFYPAVPMSGDALEDTQRIQAALESAIREYPGQWLWIHRRWKTRPPREAPLY